VGALLRGGPPARLHPDVAIGVARAAAHGEPQCGDAAVALACAGGVLLAAIDGLGRGAAAAAASGRAAALLAEHRDAPLAELVGRCHAGLAGTRGAALTVARLEPEAATLTWLAVGNVAGVLLPAGGDGPGPAALQLAGVVGAQLPPQLVPITLPLGDCDTLLLSTDGVDAGIADRLRVRGELGPLADGLLRRHRRGEEDDALVLLARYEPSRAPARSIVS
jgi:phosphoserine phosphatase RsbX